MYLIFNLFLSIFSICNPFNTFNININKNKFNGFRNFSTITYYRLNSFWWIYDYKNSLSNFLFNKLYSKLYINLYSIYCKFLEVSGISLHIENRFLWNFSFFFNLNKNKSPFTINYFYLISFYPFISNYKIKFKNHDHHIIPSYFSQLHYFSKSFNLNFFKNFFFYLNNFLISVPFYLLLVISISSLLILFFIFLHKNLNITSFNDIRSFVYYFSLIFYVFTLTYSLFNFFIYLQEEYRCTYIYTKKVEQQYLFGIILFIISEVMLFFSFFWAFFHSSLSPSIFVGNCWPPLHIVTLNPWHIPFLNTFCLLSSGITVNWFYFSLKRLSYLNSLNLILNSKQFSSNFIKFITFNLNWFTNYQLFTFKSVLSSLLKFKKLINFNINFFLIVYIKYFQYSILIFSFFFSCKFINFYIKLYTLFFNIVNLNLNYFIFNLFLKTKKLFLFFFNLFNFNIIFNYNILSGYNILKSFYLLNLLFNLSNSFTVKKYLEKSFEEIFLSLIITIHLGFLFIGFQYSEYMYYAAFSLDNIYGTVFYLLTSLHGLHVYIGLTSLLFCYSYLSSINFKFSNIHENLFSNSLITFSVWYWHFVDVVWLFLFAVIYLWGS